MKSLNAGVIALVLCLFSFPGTALADSIAPTPALAPIAFTCLPGTNSITPVLRSDFNDLRLYECPQGDDVLHAQGAQISPNFNELKQQPGASIDGLAALVVRYYGDDKLLGVAVGPYIQGDVTRNFGTSTQPYTTSDTTTTGSFAELGITNQIFGGQDYFRVRAGEVVGQITGTPEITSNTVVGEWMPVYGPVFGNALTIGIPGRLTGPIFYDFSPELMVQYDQINSGPHKYLLFSENNQAVRIGPEFVTRFWINSALIPGDSSDLLHMLVNRTSATFTYHADVETLSGRDFSWTQASLNYNFDDAGHFGATVSYGYGNSESTGSKTNQIRAGFAAKF